MSGVKYVDVYVDGKDMHKAKTTCLEPMESNVKPSEACRGLSGSWTLNGEEYAEGPRTIRRSCDGLGWEPSERSFEITVAHAANETQQVGPGTLNLISGDYKLGAT